MARPGLSVLNNLFDGVVVLAPALLIVVSWLLGGGYDLYQDSVYVERELAYAKRQLEGLQAQTVAAKIDQKKYLELVQEFAEDSRLGGSMEPSPGEAVATQLAALIRAIEREVEATSVFSEARTKLSFESVSPGKRESFAPFYFVEFEVNLEGRFFAIPIFLDLLTKISAQQRCKVSVGTLQVTSSDREGRTGRLYITLPIRAYFLES